MPLDLLSRGRARFSAASMAANRCRQQAEMTPRSLPIWSSQLRYRKTSFDLSELVGYAFGKRLFQLLG